VADKKDTMMYQKTGLIKIGPGLTQSYTKPLPRLGVIGIFLGIFLGRFLTTFLGMFRGTFL